MTDARSITSQTHHEREQRGRGGGARPGIHVHPSRKASSFLLYFSVRTEVSDTRQCAQTKKNLTRHGEVQRRLKIKLSTIMVQIHHYGTKSVQVMQSMPVQTPNNTTLWGSRDQLKWPPRMHRNQTSQIAEYLMETRLKELHTRI